MGMFAGFNLSDEENLFLTSLMQLDLLITEQFFLDTYGLSLNVASKVGTRESSILSDETSSSEPRNLFPRSGEKVSPTRETRKKNEWCSLKFRYYAFGISMESY